MRIALILSLLVAITLPAYAAPTIVIRNNHDFAYDGPVAFRTKLPDGPYKGVGGEAIVKAGTARAVVHAKGHSSVSLKQSPTWGASAGFLTVEPIPGGINMLKFGAVVGRIELGLAVIPGKSGTSAEAVASFKPLSVTLERQGDGTLTGKTNEGDYQVEIVITPYAGGWLDAQARITHTSDNSDPYYLALVRKVNVFGAYDIRTSWNGTLIQGTDDPSITDRISTLTKGVDWCSWKSGGMSWAAINQFSAGYTTQDSKGKWIPANHFYTWEKAAENDGSVYLISEIAGPNPAQEKARYMGTTSYCPPLRDEPVVLKWRLAVGDSVNPKSQLYVCAGYRNVTESKDKAVLDLGVPFVEFGTSYFPYSTMTENMDYYRTTGLDREGWWPFSPKMWENWRAFVPQMETDLRIIKAMGFDLVRLHHLELLGEMDRANAFAFMDFYMGVCRKLGLKVFVDTGGSPEWISSVVGRYKDVVKYVEIENEILIPGIPKGAPERWTAQYQAVKSVAPNTQAFLTGACNQGMFDRLTYLGVPFDRIGFHNYKHGAAYKEAIPSVALGVANQATDYGKPAVLGEFNWKLLTAMSPEDRAKEVAQIYAKMLEPRAIPTFCQFHWQETMSVNPRLTRQGIRHYETINLDRTPKPEAVELMKLIRRYANPESPYRELPIQIDKAGKFVITNATERPLKVTLAAESYQGVKCSVVRDRLSLKPGQSASGKIGLSLPVDSLPGTYHYFLRANYEGKSAYGWGMLSKPGAPKFDQPVLADLVEYPRGADVVTKFDYAKPICIAFGKDCPIVEMEMAYQLRNTLQSAIGRDIRLCAVADIPKSFADTGNLILIGTPESNKLIGMTNPELSDKGTVILQDVGSGCQWLYLTGKTSDEVRAAATDFVLRFWKNAKDSTSRISGLEKGAALGNKAAPGDVNLP